MRSVLRKTRVVMFLIVVFAPQIGIALDSDGDGLSDEWELLFFGDLAQGAFDDPDADDLPNGSEALWSTDPLNPDTDDDGLNDGLELGEGGDVDPLSITNPKVADTDGDGLLDGVEDRNHDGVTDVFEIDPLKFDTDYDAIDDGSEVGPNPAQPFDTDDDGVIDALDTDSDGDGLSDLMEAGDLSVSTPPLDSDGDGTPDYRDLDSDGDGIEDGMEATGDADLDSKPDPDVDGDGLPNHLDSDSDGDGKSDASEGVGDQDSDGVPNYLDADDEIPFKPDPEPPVEPDPQSPFLDPSGGLELPCDPFTTDCGAAERGTVHSPEKPTQGEDPADATKGVRGGFPWVVVIVEDDYDGDGIVNEVEVALGTNMLLADTDGDSIPDGLEIQNTLHPTDTDTDGYLDALDLDSDSDGIPDVIEAGPDGTSPQDTDLDGTPDFRDFDSDSDGLNDRVEVTVTMTDPTLVDTDGGSVPDGVEVARGTDPLDPSDDELEVEPIDPWEGAQFQGGLTCGAVPLQPTNSSPVCLLLACAFVLLLAWRRGWRGTSSTRRVAGLALLLMSSLPARAQTGVDSQTLYLTAAGTSLLGNHNADTLGQWGYTASVSSQFQRDPLVVLRDGDILRNVLEDRVDVTTHGAVGLMPWLDLGLDIPVVAHTAGTAVSDASISGSGLGDIRIWTKFMALDQERFGVNLGLVATLGTPTGDPEMHTGAGEATFDADLLLGARLGGVHLALSLGYRVAPSHEVLDFLAGDRLTYSIAGSYHHVPTRLGATVRLFGSTRAVAPFEQLHEANMEALASLDWVPVPGFVVEAGGGAGLMPGAGTPSFRAFASVGWSQPKSREPAPDLPSDRDGDGIVDERDKCPGDAEDADGFLDTDGCPDLDNDQDGIADAKDQCPDQGEDKDGFQDADGCPDPDNDRDGILDAADKCPLKAETLNGLEDTDGCPDKTLVEYDVEDGRIRVLLHAAVHFDWNDDEVPKQYKAVLKQVAYVMKVHPEIKLLRVEGHTSWTGDYQWNMGLSRRRSAVVTGWLMHFGVESQRVIARGYGFTHLKVKKRGPKHNWVNRRVEFVIVDPPGLAEKARREERAEPAKGERPEVKPKPRSKHRPRSRKASEPSKDDGP